MKKSKFIIILIAVFVLFAVIFSVITSHSGNTMQKPEQSAATVKYSPGSKLSEKQEPSLSAATSKPVVKQDVAAKSAVTEPAQPLKTPPLPVELGIVKLNIDDYFTIIKRQKNGPTAIYGLAGKQRQNGTSCKMVVSIMDTSKFPAQLKARRPTLNQLLASVLKGQQGGFKQFKESAFEEIKINDLNFKKVSWEAQTNDAAVRGIIYATRDGDYYVAISAQDAIPYDQKSLVKCEEVINSFSFNKKNEQAAIKPLD